MFDQRAQTELRRLLEKLCEERLEAGDAARIEEIVLADRRAARFYLDYLALHGSLHWDAAVNNASDSSLALPRIFAAVDDPEIDPVPVESAPVVSIVPHEDAVPRRRWSSVAVIAASLAIATIVGLFVFRGGPDNDELAGQPLAPVDDRDDPAREIARGDGPRKPPQPVRIDGLRPPRPAPDPDEAVVVRPRTSDPDEELPVGGSSDDVIVAFIDQQIDAGHVAAEIEPSDVADDAEWVRRIHLDLAGHIPAAETVNAFVESHDADKRAKLVRTLLDDPAYARHFATNWTNLFVGRLPSAAVDRDGLQAYLRQAFGRNRPWSDIVREVVSAEGSVEENGSTNFLVAHLNDQAVPATAIMAQRILGVQVQCMQCHDHPWNDWTQDQFWELNAFFKQTELVDRNGNVRLENEHVGGPTLYETKSGLMMAAYPRYEGRAVDPAAETNRRAALADLMLDGDRTRVAEAIVNRLWAHFMGHGFTTPVDDMGPHNPPTHPALLARLSAEFVRSGYDVERLIGWITASAAYQRTSRFGESNDVDAPDLGEVPLFSRVYVKPMTPEQMYDSLVMATWGDAADWQRTTADRDRWIRDYVRSNETDENDETLALDGSIPQALAIMNGELTTEGTSLRSGTLLQRIVSSKESVTAKIRGTFVAALSREPTKREFDAVRRMLKTRRGGTRGEAEGLQDLYWALLNSNEFVQVH